ncbi:MAG: hypothetical protein AB7R40_23625 [Nitrospiraceae bacterium]
MRWTVALALAGLSLAACKEEPHVMEPAKRSANIEDVRPDPNIIYGDEVFVLARRGMGGKSTDHATWYFAADARKLCGIRFEVESRSTAPNPWSEWIFRKTHRAQRARLVVFVGTSLGGLRATEHAIRWQKDGGGQPVRLLLIDTVPWTPAIPKNVGKDHVVWRNTVPLQFGGGRPEGTIDDPQHDRPRFLTHGILIHSPQTRKEVVTEICRGITHPSKRKTK